MRRSTQAALSIILTYSACTLGTAPDLSPDAYTLTEIGGMAPPVRVGSETWLADTISFDSGGSWTRVEVVILHTEGSSLDPIKRRSEGFITRKGGKIVLDFDCGADALRLCVAPDTLRRVNGGFVRRPNTYGAAQSQDPEFRYEPAG